ASCTQVSPHSTLCTMSTNNQVVVRPLKAGIYCPVATFFSAQSEDLDLTSFQVHVVHVAKAGVAPLVAGSMGEAIHLSHAERTALIKAARQALDGAGFETVPVIAGTGTGSTRETLELCNLAAEAGADYAIVIISGYYAGVLASNTQALKDYWTEVSNKSPLPVIIYNYPGAAGGIDLDSDIITDLATNCSNLAGVKLTCGNVGKLTRICSVVSDPAWIAAHPRKNPNAPFRVFGGFVDFVIPSTFVNGDGAIAGLVNVAPYATAKLFELSEAAKKDLTYLPEAQRLQGIVAQADYTIGKAAIAGAKYILEKMQGYGGNCRRPLPPMDAAAAKALWEHPHTQALVAEEKKLNGQN
ncbi:L-threo-3-deoxy-hexylosonate aldolase, partial [Grifola frondosa]